MIRILKLKFGKLNKKLLICLKLLGFLIMITNSTKKKPNLNTNIHVLCLTE